MIESTEISTSSPIMMLWLDLRVRTSMVRHLPAYRCGDGDPASPCLMHMKAVEAVECVANDGYPDVARGNRTRRALGSAPPMARRSLRPHLNQIRGWVRQGRTDAWIAHQLEVTVQQIEQFKRENELVEGGEAPAGPGLDFDDEIDLRAEDDALIAAELEAAAAEEDSAEDEDGDGDGDGEGEGDDDKPRRRRGRR